MSIPWEDVFANLARIDIWFYCAIGVLIGLTAGAIPGVSGSMAITLVLPLALVLDTYQTVAIFCGIYKGADIGGAITAICFGVPGTSSAAADLMDGYPMTLKGKSKKALDAMLYSSFLGNTTSDILLLFSIGILTPLVYFFGPSEMIGCLFLSIICIIVFIGGNPLKVAISLLIGTLIALTGPSEHYAVARFSIGIEAFEGGIQLVPLMLGLFAFSKVIALGMEKNKEIKKNYSVTNERLSFKEFIGCWRELIVSWITGAIIGALPGVGATIAGYTSYGVAKKVSKNADNFGTGVLEGLCAVECGNSASSGANFIPLFTLGIPGSTTAALFLVALLMNGIVPGPAAIRDTPDIIFSIFVLILIANLVSFVLSKLLIPVFAYLAYLPNYILSPFICIMAITGVYAFQNSFNDVILMFIFGLIGFVLDKNKYPLAPVVIGFVLVPLLEAELVRGLSISRGQIAYFFKSTTFVITFTAGIFAILMTFWSKRKTMLKMFE